MFGAICANRPVQTNLKILSPTQFAFIISPFPSFSHIVVFLLPGHGLPDGTAAGVYIRLPRFVTLRQRQRRQQQQQQRQRQYTHLDQQDGFEKGVTDGTEQQSEFTFLGAIANEKQSAIFRIRLDGDGINTGGKTGPTMERELAGGGHVTDDDAMVDETNDLGLGSINADVPEVENQEDMITLGVSIEPVANITAQLATVHPSSLSVSSPSTSTWPSTALTVRPKSPIPPNQATTQRQAEDRLLLARRIITHAFNFLASFAMTISVPSTSSTEQSQKFGQDVSPINSLHESKTIDEGVVNMEREDVIPLRAFRDWWTRFEKKIQSNPTFLERDD